VTLILNLRARKKIKVMADGIHTKIQARSSVDGKSLSEGYSCFGSYIMSDTD
jgi:hypothetical protein